MSIQTRVLYGLYRNCVGTALAAASSLKWLTMWNLIQAASGLLLDYTKLIPDAGARSSIQEIMALQQQLAMLQEAKDLQILALQQQLTMLQTLIFQTAGPW